MQTIFNLCLVFMEDCKDETLNSWTRVCLTMIWEKPKSDSRKDLGGLIMYHTLHNAKPYVRNHQ